MKRPFGLKDKLGYMFGDFANDFFFILVSSFLMVFYTDILGVNAAIVGTLYLVARCVDAFTDIGMGQIVDRAKPNKLGRYRVWIKRMRLPVVLAGVLVFVPWAANLPYGGRIAYIFITYILWGSFAYTSINIPYGSMAAAMTDKPGERASLSTMRSVGASLAGVLVGSITPLFVYDTVETVTDTGEVITAQVLNGTKIFIVALVFAVLAFTFYTLCYKWCEERVEIFEVAEKPQSLGHVFKTLFTSRPLMSLIVASIVSLLSMFVVQSMNTYLYKDYFNNITAMSVSGLLTTGCTLIVAPFASKLAKKYGKKEVCCAGLLLAGIVYGIVFFLKIKNPWVFCVFLLIANIGSALFTLLTWALIGDVIDYQTVKTGDSDGGTIYGMYSFARKIGQALAGGLSGAVLSAIGYVSAVAGETIVQTTQVTTAIYNVETGTAALGYLAVAAILFFAYPLGKKTCEEVSSKLMSMNNKIVEEEASEK